MYSTHSEGKSVVAERFIRTLNDKTYKYMASISKNVYIDKLDDKYNKTYQRTIKMKPVDVNPSMYIDFNKENNGQDPKLKLVILLEHQNIKIVLQKAVFQIGLKKFL